MVGDTEHTLQVGHNALIFKVQTKPLFLTRFPNDVLGR